MRQEAFGRKKLTFVDRFGVYLSQEPIFKVVRSYQHPSLLDIGCGYQAHLLQNLRPLIEQGVGVDVQINPSARTIPNLSFYEQPIEQAFDQLKGQAFDIVMMVSVLEHLVEPLDVLRACYGLLKPGGTLILNVPNWRGKFFLELSAFKLGLSPAYEMDDHKMYYDKRDLWPLLVRAGFKPSLIHLKYHKFSLNLFATAQKGKK